MINNNEIIYKMKAVIEYLKNNSGYDYELYNRLCPNIGEPDWSMFWTHNLSHGSA